MPQPRKPGVVLAVCLSAIVAGCQAPAAHVASTGTLCPNLSRSQQLTGQLVADSAVEIACHPLQHCRHLLTEPGEHLRALGDGLAGRCLLCRGQPGPCDGTETLDPVALEDELHHLTQRQLQPAQLQLHIDGQEALDALQRLIDQAECSIDVLMFQWESDELGEAVARRLAAKAGPELRVRILVDGGGNLIFGQPADGQPADVNRVVRELAQQPHVELIRTRNPFGRFDHRKLVLVDSQVAWTGGRNFTHAAFFRQHDLSVTLTGPIVQEMQECFDAFWQEQGGKPEPRVDETRGPRCARPRGLEEINAAARLVCTSPTELELAQVVYHAVDRARQHVWLENVYLTDSRLIRKLVQARRRGVDVRVLLSRDSQSDLVDRANRVTVNRLLRAGVRVYLYPGMTHVKALSVDGRWAYLGTANCDVLSMRHNRELGLAIGAGGVIAELEERLFDLDLRPDWELTHPLPVHPFDFGCELLANLCL